MSNAFFSCFILDIFKRKTALKTHVKTSNDVTLNAGVYLRILLIQSGRCQSIVSEHFLHKRFVLHNHALNDVVWLSFSSRSLLLVCGPLLAV